MEIWYRSFAEGWDEMRWDDAGKWVAQFERFIPTSSSLIHAFLSFARRWYLDVTFLKDLHQLLISSITDLKPGQLQTVKWYMGNKNVRKHVTIDVTRYNRLPGIYENEGFIRRRSEIVRQNRLCTNGRRSDEYPRDYLVPSRDRETRPWGYSTGICLRLSLLDGQL
jgi:hypothetical protein